MNTSQLLTIDADWAVRPTPLQIERGVDMPHRTLEAEVYDYGFPEGKRPASDRHAIVISPEQLAQKLFEAGLPRNLPVFVSRNHDAVKHPLTRHCPIVTSRRSGKVLKDFRIVCLDAHLDAYPMATVDFDIARPGVKLHDIFYFEDIPTIVARLHLDPQETATLESIFPELSKLIELQSWILHLTAALVRFPTGALEIDWVIPEHFEEALGEGFPYPDAQWYTTLEVGKRAKLWNYVLNAKERLIRIQPTPKWGKDILIRMLPFAKVKNLKNTVAVHVCCSPEFTPVEIDSWVGALSELLAGEAHQVFVLNDSGDPVATNN